MHKINNMHISIDQMNEAIALFMDVKPYEDSRYGILYNSPVDSKTCFSLKYHSSWDWLMPVISKLKESFKETAEIDSDGTHMHNFGINFQLSIVSILSAHLAVYHAIKWCNKQKKTPH